MTDSTNLRVRIKAVTYEADGILSFDLRAADGAALPPFTAGAHIDVHLRDTLTRSYSLSNSQDERHRYVIAVNKDAASRGGSKQMHEQLRAGEFLQISAPRNNFALVEDAPHVVLIGGGIGITPLWSMLQRLESLGRSWELYYAARTKAQTAFREAIEALPADRRARVHLNFDHEPGATMFDLGRIVAGVRADAHLYCCGPIPMLEAFEKACAGRPPEQVHVEYFSAKEAPAVEGGYTVVLKQSGRSFAIPPGKTILDVLLDAGIDVPYSCMEGVCASCETRVIEGIPDHRDLVLTKAEQAANRTIMICCSGAKSERLVLDL